MAAPDHDGRQRHFGGEIHVAIHPVGDPPGAEQVVVMGTDERATVEERQLVGERPGESGHESEKRLGAVTALPGAAPALELRDVCARELRVVFAAQETDHDVAVDATRVDLGALHAVRHELGAELIDAGDGVHLRTKQSS